MISFDTPKCVFPLKISAVGGKPSEVSLYVLSAEPLLNRFIFDQTCDRLDQRHAEWEEQRPQREKARDTSMRNSRSMGLGFFLDSFYTTNRPAAIPPHLRDWSRDDLIAIAKEDQSPMPSQSLGDYFYASPGEMLQSMHLKSSQIPQCARNLPRLKGRDWCLTKQVWTFAPTEMDDLEFQPAIPAVVSAVRRPAGTAAAQVLSQLGTAASSSLALALKSTNQAESLNATRNLERLRDKPEADTLLRLLKDEVPQVRLHAVLAADANWDRRFADMC